MTAPATPLPGRAPSRVPRWARILIVVLIAVVVALVAIVAVRLAVRNPPIPTGVTAAENLRLGSCLAEAGATQQQYTVVPCPVPHAQQVFATADVELPEAVYATAGDALSAFADQVCARYLEYRLFLVDDLETAAFGTAAIAIPTPEAYAAGDTEALCVVFPVGRGSTQSDLYRPAP